MSIESNFNLIKFLILLLYLFQDDSSDDEGPVLRDGTIEASVRNPKPLRDLLPHR